jgi:hypothetical protein
VGKNLFGACVWAGRKPQKIGEGIEETEKRPRRRRRRRRKSVSGTHTHTHMYVMMTNRVAVV